MDDEPRDAASQSPALALDWFNSRWGREDQRGNGNLMTPQKVLEAVALIKTGEIVSLGVPYDSRVPLAPGRAYALRMPGGPTGGPYGSKSRTIWNDEFIATEIGQIGTQMDALGHLGCMCGARDKTHMLFYNGAKLSQMWSPYGLKKLGIENAPPFFTRGVLFDVQGLKGRVLGVGEEIRLADLRACLERQGRRRGRHTAGRRGIRADRPRIALVHRDEHFLRRRARHRPRMCALVFEPGSLHCRRDNFAVEVVPPVDPEVFHPCHQHLSAFGPRAILHANGLRPIEGLVREQFDSCLARPPFPTPPPQVGREPACALIACRMYLQSSGASTDAHASYRNGQLDHPSALGLFDKAPHRIP